MGFIITAARHAVKGVVVAEGATKFLAYDPPDNAADCGNAGVQRSAVFYRTVNSAHYATGRAVASSCVDAAGAIAVRYRAAGGSIAHYATGRAVASSCANTAGAVAVRYRAASPKIARHTPDIIYSFDIDDTLADV